MRARGRDCGAEWRRPSRSAVAPAEAGAQPFNSEMQPKCCHGLCGTTAVGRLGCDKIRHPNGSKLLNLPIGHERAQPRRRTKSPGADLRRCVSDCPRQFPGPLQYRHYLIDRTAYVCSIWPESEAGREFQTCRVPALYRRRPALVILLMRFNTSWPTSCHYARHRLELVL